MRTQAPAGREASNVPKTFANAHAHHARAIASREDWNPTTYFGMWNGPLVRQPKSVSESWLIKPPNVDVGRVACRKDEWCNIVVRLDSFRLWGALIVGSSTHQDSLLLRGSAEEDTLDAILERLLTTASDMSHTTLLVETSRSELTGFLPTQSAIYYPSRSMRYASLREGDR